jgi:hypothetical protein
VWKIRDLMDYQEGALEATEGKIRKPEPLDEKATAEKQKQYNIELDYYRKANSYAKSMITASVTDIVYRVAHTHETFASTLTGLSLSWTE